MHSYKERRERLIAVYSDKIKKMRSYASKNSRACFEQIDRIEKNCTKREHSEIKGRTLYRGYYHPNVLDDLLTGYWTRGKLFKRPYDPEQKKKYLNFVYTYNTDGKLGVIHQYYASKNINDEVLLYIGNTVEGYTFYGNVLSHFTKEEYDEKGRLVSVQRLTLEPYEHKWKSSMYDEHTLVYSDDGLEKAVYIHYSEFINGECDLVESRYKFERDEDGNISSYKVIYPTDEYANDAIRQFDVLKKMKL